MPPVNTLAASVEQMSAEAKRLRETAAAMADKVDADSRVRLTRSEEAEFKRLHAEASELEARIAEIRAQDDAESGAGEASLRVGGAHVTREAGTYRPDGEASYFGDLINRQVHSDYEAAQRLDQYGAELRVNPNRTDGQGGYFVPPAWLMEEYVELARAGRVTADLCRQMPLPEGTDSINVPKIATGATAEIQTADAAAVSSTDITDTYVTAPVRTIAGQQDIALQLLEQSPAEFDRVIFGDLLADYNQKLNAQVLKGTGLSGQVTGILNVSSINTTTYTDGSPTVPELWPKAVSARNDVDVNRFLPPEAIVMHPRRWNWMLAALDSQNRPYVVPTEQGPANAVAISQNLSGQVGTWLSLPVFTDAGIPTTAGGGTEDQILMARFSDILLFEGQVRTRVLAEVLSGTLQVRLQLYNYVAFMASRQPKSISVISGTGLAAPTF